MSSRIPIHKSPDSFNMDENTVNLNVISYFNSRGINVVSFAMNREPGIDVLAEKNGYTLIVESKGQMANNQNEFVFGGGQIKTHISAQVYYLMKKQYEGSSKKTLFIMANPDITRIRNGIKAISHSLDKLGFIKLWIKKDKSIEIECPKELVSIASIVGLV